ncbi:MAG: ribonuclease P protein component [Anaerolineales bacterium]|nr:ribonuclease P protein component [Anaerolineales bacterium]
MLPKQYRLRRSAEIKRVRELGQGWRHPLAILLVVKNEQTISRFAFTASRGVGKAVARNRARRLLREAVRLHLSEIETGWDCVWIARAKTADATFSEVETAVLHLLSRARLLRTDTLPGAASEPEETGRGM